MRLETFLMRLTTIRGGHADGVRGANTVTPRDGNEDGFDEIRREVVHLRTVLAEEGDRANAIRKEIAALEGERIAALVRSRVGSADGKEGVLGDVMEKIERARLALTDAEAVAESVRTMLRDAQPRYKEAARVARKALGRALDERFEALAEEYNTGAMRAADCAAKMTAAQALMISLGVGNSNGFEPRAYLPLAQPGEGRTLQPIVDSGAKSFRAHVDREKRNLTAQLRAAGFYL